MATPPHGAPSNGTSKDTPPAVPASPQLSDRIKITSALASWAGNDRLRSGSVSEEKKEKRKRSSTERWLVHELTGRTGSLFSLRRLVGKDKDKEEASPTVPRKVGRGGDASSPNLGRKAATHRHSRSASMTNGTDMADAEPTGASSPQSQPPALLSPPHQHGLVSSARDDQVKDAMKETVKLQQTLAQCDKDLQVLTSKLESAKSNLAFLNKRQEELRDHGADLRAATAEYRRLVAVETTSVERATHLQQDWTLCANGLEHYVSLCDALLARLDARIMDELELKKQKAAKRLPSAPPPAVPTAAQPVPSGGATVRSPREATSPAPMSPPTGSPLDSSGVVRLAVKSDAAAQPKAEKRGWRASLSKPAAPTSGDEVDAPNNKIT